MQEYTQAGIEQAVQEALNEQKIPNILICGQTGTGKSSAVNFLFDDAVTTVGDFEPCTKDIKLFKNAYINIYDSEGYEIGSEKQTHYRDMLLTDFLLKKQSSRVGDDAVHMVWYAISAAGKRFTDLDIDLVNSIKQAGFPVAILLTKIDGPGKRVSEEMKKSIQAELPQTPVFMLSIDKDEKVQALCDWKTLTQWSYNALPEVYKNRFVAALKDGLEEKKAQAQKIIKKHLLKLIVANPVPQQTALVVQLFSIYNIKVERMSILQQLSSESLVKLSKAIEKALKSAADLIQPKDKYSAGAKALFYIGGELVRIGSYSMTTKVLGEAISYVCYNHCKALLEGKDPLFDIDQILTSSEFIQKMVDSYRIDKAMAEANIEETDEEQ